MPTLPRGNIPTPSKNVLYFYNFIKLFINIFEKVKLFIIISTIQLYFFYVVNNKTIYF